MSNSVTQEVIRSVIKKVVKFDMPPTDAVELIDDLFLSLDWYKKVGYKTEDFIENVKICVNSRYFVGDKESYLTWINKYDK